MPSTVRGRLRQVLRQGRRLHGHVRSGAIHLLNGLYDAKLDHVPVVAIVGQTERSAMGGSYQQEVDLQALLKDVASEYLVEVNIPEQLPLGDRPRPTPPNSPVLRRSSTPGSGSRSWSDRARAEPPTRSRRWRTSSA